MSAELEPFPLRRRYRLALRARLVCCRAGLHFLAHDLQGDRWVCACRRQWLNAEQVRRP